jgi:hypothetical protein
MYKRLFPIQLIVAFCIVQLGLGSVIGIAEEDHSLSANFNSIDSSKGTSYSPAPERNIRSNTEDSSPVTLNASQRAEGNANRHFINKDTVNETREINRHGVCQKVSSGLNLFVPTGTAKEWQNFRNWAADNNNKIQLKSCCLTLCGNGVIDSLAAKREDCGEQCDNGVASNGIACVAGYGASCTYCSNECANVTVQGPSCGDGIVNGTEQCDDADLNSQTCQTQGYQNGSLSCNADCNSFNAWASCASLGYL